MTAEMRYCRLQASRPLRSSSRCRPFSSSSTRAKAQTTAYIAASEHDVSASAQLPQYKLSNGLTIRHTSSRAEVEFLYREHFQQRVYLQHGVSLAPGAVVIDVGANIGLFAMTAAEAVGDEGQVICVEPEPRAAAALTHNIQQHRQRCCTQATQVAPCTVIQAAAADGSVSEAQLTVYQGASGWSTLVRDDQEVISNMQRYISSLLLPNTLQTPSANVANGSNWAAVSDAALDQQNLLNDDNLGAMRSSRGWTVTQQMLAATGGWLSGQESLKPLAGSVAKAYVQKVMVGKPETVSVRTCTISDIIQQQNLPCVDLLKIDVERAELDVLQGVQQHHWPRIRQVAMEVHDIEGQLSQVVQLLQQRGGFREIVWQQDFHLQGSTLYNLYAIRSGH